MCVRVYLCVCVPVILERKVAEACTAATARGVVAVNQHLGGARESESERERKRRVMCVREMKRARERAAYSHTHTLLREACTSKVLRSALSLSISTVCVCVCVVDLSLSGSFHFSGAYT